MAELGKEHPSYVASAILSQKIKLFHDSKIVHFLKAACPQIFHEIDNEQPYAKAFKQMSEVIEPIVLHVRSGGSNNELRKSIVERLCEEEGFVNLDINSLIRDENERRTLMGLEFLNMVAQAKVIPAEMIVRMLRKIIYSGDGHFKFILSSFPDIIEHAKEFEKNCATITAIIYTYGQESAPYVEIKSNNLTLYNIDALFQKEFRLKTMNQYDEGVIKEIVAPKTDYVLLTGPSLSGKTTLAQLVLKNVSGFKHFDLRVVEEAVKKSKGTEEEPFEGEVPAEELLADLEKQIKADKASGNQFKYLLEPDSAKLDNAVVLLQKAMFLGPPKLWIHVTS
mmetsp:Transcript_3635/g.2692  ORF Transcript_3635/g.2692 Transcript_3635/m.2692 type:complete len:337 (+) Transcript_3635:903-1913(+)